MWRERAAVAELEGPTEDIMIRGVYGIECVMGISVDKGAGTIR